MSPALEVQIGASIKDLTRRLDAAERAVKGFEKDVDGSTDKVDKSFNETGNNIDKFGSKVDDVMAGVAAGIAAAFSVNAIINFSKAVFDITANFQKLQAVLTNTLGSSAIADLKLKELQDFASTTPFGVAELTESFVKLANQGFAPSITQIRQLGDLASSTGKSFDQLAEAILDAQTGEYERLKEFGIRARDAGDTVIFTFKGVQTEVAKSSTAIRDYITGLGDAEGVTGSMAAISETLSGKVSNLQDDYDILLKTIGEGNSGVFVTTIDLLSEMVRQATDFNEVLNTISENDFGSSFGVWLNQLREFANPMAVTTMGGAEVQARLLHTYRDELTKTNSEFISGAKNVSEYADRIVEVRKRMGEAIMSAKTPELREAIRKEFDLAIQQLQDSYNQLLKGRGVVDAGFGSGGSDEKRTGKSEAEKAAERLTAALQKHDDKRRLAAAEGREKDKAALEIYYRDLLELAKGKNDATMQLQNDFRADMEALNKEWDGKEAQARLKAQAMIWGPVGEAMTKHLEGQKKKINDNIAKIEKEWEEMARKTYETQRYYADQMGNAIGNALEDALGRGENIFQALGREFKRMIIRMIADAAALKAANIFQGLMSGKGGGGGGGGNWWSWLGTAASWALKIWGSGKGGGAAASNLNSASPMPVSSMSANSFVGNPSIANSAGIHIRVTGDLRGNGRDLSAVIKAAQIEENIYFGR